MEYEQILMPLKEACRSFGVSYSTIYDAVVNGDLPAEFARGRWRVEPVAVREWLRSAPDYRTNQLT